MITYEKYVEALDGAYVFYNGALVSYVDQEGTRYNAFTNATNAGTYHLMIVASAGDNYNKSYLTATLTIMQKVLTPTWTVTDSESASATNANSDGITWNTTYNGNNWTMDATVSAGICAGDTVTIANFNGTNIFKDADTYQLTAVLAGADAANYILDANATATLEIAKRTITANWAVYNASGSALTTVNGTVAYDKIAHGLTVTIGNLVAGESVNFTLSTNVETSGGATFTSVANSATYSAVNVLIDNSTVAAYTVSLTAVNDNNYSFAGASASFTITKATIISNSDIFVNDVTTPYDKTVKALAMGHINALSDGLTRYGDVFTATFSYYTVSDDTAVANPVNVGEYYGVVALTAGSNYNDVTLGESKDILLTITAVDIANVTFANGSGAYNGNSHDVNIAITNENESGMTQYNDAIVSVTYTYYTDSARTESVTAANVKNARKYYTRAVVDAGSNYNVLTLDAEYDITSLNVTLTVSYTVTPDRDNRMH